MAGQHAPRFLKLVEDAKGRVRETTVEDVKARLDRGERFALLDVREDSEWQAGHAALARHLGKGVLEPDIEKLFPDPNTEIIMYCGGGYRSALACDVAQQMGYKNVASLAGGHKAMVQAGWEMAR